MNDDDLIAHLKCSGPLGQEAADLIERLAGDCEIQRTKIKLMNQRSTELQARIKELEKEIDSIYEDMAGENI